MGQPMGCLLESDVFEKKQLIELYKKSLLSDFICCSKTVKKYLWPHFVDIKQ